MVTSYVLRRAPCVSSRLGAVAAFAVLSVSLAVAQGAERTIEIHARKYAFVPAQITLKEGEPVKLLLISDDVPHGLAVPALDLHANIVQGHPTEVTLTPEKTGDFPGECSRSCGSGHSGMRFMIHVVAKQTAEKEERPGTP